MVFIFMVSDIYHSPWPRTSEKMSPFASTGATWAKSELLQGSLPLSGGLSGTGRRDDSLARHRSRAQPTSTQTQLDPPRSAKNGRFHTIDELTAAAEQEACKRPEVLRLMTHPGVGPITALSFLLIIGTPERFHCGKQIGSYIGLIPSEDSSA